MNPYEGFTVVLGYEKGMVPLVTVEKPKSFIEKVMEAPSMVLFLSSVFIGSGGIFIFWYKNGRDYWQKDSIISVPGSIDEVKPLGAHETVVVEYEPPDDLRPAEIGVLVDEMAHTHDVTATIVDLAVRGYLSITEIPKKWMFGKSDYLLTRKKTDTSQLTQYEVTLLNHLFGTQTEVHISELKNTFYKKLAEVKTELYKEIVSKQFFSDNPEKNTGQIFSYRSSYAYGVRRSDHFGNNK